MPSLESLGFRTYTEYLRSPTWVSFRRRYSANKLTRKKCLVCDSPRYQLHHTTYERLGSELFSDVMPLCQGHHVEVHRWLRTRQQPVQRSRDAVSYIKKKISQYGEHRERRQKQRKKGRRHANRPAKVYYSDIPPTPIRWNSNKNKAIDDNLQRILLQDEWDELWEALVIVREMLPEDHEILECSPWEFATNPFEKVEAMRVAFRMTRDAVLGYRNQSKDDTARFPDTQPTFPRKTPSAAQSSDIR